jgi:hypothetical protein
LQHYLTDALNSQFNTYCAPKYQVNMLPRNVDCMGAMMIRASLILTGAMFAFVSGAHAADLPLKAAPIAAQPAVSGYLGLYIGGSTSSNDSNYDDHPHGGVFAFGAVGAVNTWLSSGMSVQFSAHAEGTSGYDYDCCSYTEARFSGIMGGHVALRDPNSHAVGVFAAFTGTNNMAYDGANGGALGGIEAQKYLGNLTLYGQLGLGGQFNDAQAGMIDDYWFIRGVARYFINPNLRVDGEISYADGDHQKWYGESGGSIDILSWGLGIENRLTGSPFSFFAGYAGDRIKGQADFCNNSNEVTQHTFLVGAKMNFGEPTLLANDRHGATFDLPKFHRAMPWSEVSGWGSNCIR